MVEDQASGVDELGSAPGFRIVSHIGLLYGSVYYSSNTCILNKSIIKTVILMEELMRYYVILRAQPMNFPLPKKHRSSLYAQHFTLCWP